MRPQNQSERQSAIFRFWAIYIVAMLLPIIAFYFIFKNASGGPKSEDYKKLSAEIYEYSKVVKVINQTDSLMTVLQNTDFKLKNPGVAESEKTILENTAVQIVGNLQEQKRYWIDNMKIVKYDNTKKYATHMPNIIDKVLVFHAAYIKDIKNNTSESAKDAKISQLEEEVRKLGVEKGTLTAQISVLQNQMAKSK